MSNYRVLFIALLTFSITLAGCDSNDDSDDPGAAFEMMGEMMASSFSALGFVAADIFINQAASKSQPVYPCNTGQVEYTQSTTNPEIYTLDFQDCDGTTGNIDLGLTIDISETSFNFGLLLDGSLTNQCTLSFSSFNQSVVSSATDQSQSIVIDGAIGASCNGQSYACVFDQASLTVTEDSDDYALFENSCALTN